VADESLKLSYTESSKERRAELRTIRKLLAK
jgi:hypothetical protein